MAFFLLKIFRLTLLLGLILVLICLFFKNVTVSSPEVRVTNGDLRVPILIKVKNCGLVPVKIENVTGNCDCATISYRKNIIYPFCEENITGAMRNKLSNDVNTLLVAITLGFFPEKTILAKVSIFNVRSALERVDACFWWNIRDGLVPKVFDWGFLGEQYDVRIMSLPQDFTVILQEKKILVKPLTTSPRSGFLRLDVAEFLLEPPVRG